MSKILALDYGSKNIGLALSDDEQKIAFAYKTLKNTVETRHALSLQNMKKVISDIKDICVKERVEKIVVGLPINLAGEKTASTQAVLNFIEELKKNLALPVETFDERLTSVEAIRQGNGRGTIDEHAAQILLQAWLDKNCSTRL